MAVVYVVQQQMKRFGRSNQPRFDMGPAKAYGDLRILLRDEADQFDPSVIIDILRTNLAPITSDDYLLLVGNPCLIGWACAIAAKNTGGYLNMLQWDRDDRCYVSVKTKLPWS